MSKTLFHPAPLGELESIRVERDKQFDPMKDITGLPQKQSAGEITVAEVYDNGMMIQVYDGSKGFDLLYKQMDKVSEALISSAADEDDDQRRNMAREFFGGSLVRIDNYQTSKGNPGASVYAVVSSSARGASINILPDYQIAQIHQTQNIFYSHQRVANILSKMPNMVNIAKNVLQQMISRGEVTKEEGEEVLKALENSSKDGSAVEEIFSRMPFGWRKSFSELASAIDDVKSFSGSVDEDKVRQNARRDFSDYLDLKVMESTSHNRLALELHEDELEILSDEYEVTPQLLQAPMPHSPFRGGVSFLRNKAENSVSILFDGVEGSDTAWTYITDTDNCYVRVRRYDGQVPFSYYEDGKLVDVDTSNMKIGEVVIDTGVVFRLKDGEYKALSLEEPTKEERDSVRGAPQNSVWVDTEFPSGQAEFLKNRYQQLSIKAMSLIDGEKSLSTLEAGHVQNMGFVGRSIVMNDEGKKVDLDAIDNGAFEYAPSQVSIYGNDGLLTTKVAEMVFKIEKDGDDYKIDQNERYLKIPDKRSPNEKKFIYEKETPELLKELGCKGEDLEKYEEDIDRFFDKNSRLTVYAGKDKAGNDIYAKIDFNQETSPNVTALEVIHVASGREKKRGDDKDSFKKILEDINTNGRSS